MNVSLNVEKSASESHVHLSNAHSDHKETHVDTIPVDTGENDAKKASVTRGDVPSRSNTTVTKGIAAIHVTNILLANVSTGELRQVVGRVYTVTWVAVYGDEQLSFSNYGVISEERLFEDCLFMLNTLYPEKKIRRISAWTSQENVFV
nr:hypothetical protein [Tanacetum cinerariifolium]